MNLRPIYLGLTCVFLTVDCMAQMPDPPGQVQHGETPKNEAYLFAHMMQGDYWRLYYSVSLDGLHWEMLNGGKRVCGEYRDHASIVRGHDGRYYLVGNRGDAQPDINFWVSDDLVKWQKYSDYVQDLNHVPDYPKAMARIGAPKLFFDQLSAQYLRTWHTVQKLNLFLEFRSDKTIRAVIHRAKSILAVDHTFFSVESKHQRQQGPELHERFARVFAEQVLERQPGEILPLTTAYLVFCEYLKQKSMPVVKRGVFRGMFSPIIRDVFNLGLRNDIHDPVTKHQTAGWKGIRTLDLEDDLVEKEAA